MNGEVTHRLERIRKRAFVVGLGATAVSLVAGIFAPAAFLHAYLVGFLFWIGLGLGCLALLMLHHLVGGAWGLVIRRMLEAGTRTLPLMTVAVVPLLAGAARLYPWAGARPGAVELGEKSAYLNVPFFLARTAAYFAVWHVLARLLDKWSREEETSGAPDARPEGLSGPGLVLYGLTVTFASVDWVMSLEPHWSSTIYGITFMVGQVLATLALAILFLAALGRYEPLSDVLEPSHFHDLGNLMLAFVMLWAYVSFSQYLIIWSGNLPEEVTWYARRTEGGWGWFPVILILFHFALPFVLLLQREVKRRARVLTAVAAAMILMRLVDLVWIVEPAFHRSPAEAHWLDLLLPVGMGGIWLGVFGWQLGKRPLLPLRGRGLPARALEEAHGS